MSARIVIGVNGSPADRRTARWAAIRAAETGESLEFVHVVDEAIRATGNADFLLAAQSAARTFIDEAVAIARSIAPEATIETEIEQGDPFRIIGEHAEDASLLVVGSDWTGGERPTTRGTKSLRFAATSHDVPVAIVPDIEVGERPGVVVGVDGSEIAQRALEFAAGEAERRGGPLIVIHAWTIPLLADYNYGFEYAYTADYAKDLDEGARAELDAALEGFAERHPGLDVRKVVVQDDPVVALTEAAGQRALLVVGTHGRGAIARLFLGSVSHGVLTNMVAPTVLVQ
ncbi:universal stress protein [Agromyces archimandritae]|uniref:Universal stress protein n=1 Tax=Agromyces archimandritae TaxID=2781962 RepID=A0A975FKZ5_9MICO|nr:universal stress protein [Agromyces archimandritae]QTX04014.1 universal stress protein [Agromyces archimandritae]